MALRFYKFFWILVLPLLISCTALLNNKPHQTSYYALKYVPTKTVSNLNNSELLPILIVSTPKSVAGLNTHKMLYSRKPLQIEYFAHNEWIDTPANMLQNILTSSLEHTGLFKAVMLKTSAIKSEYRLDSQLLSLVQNFESKPSHIEFSLKVTLIDNQTNQVMASRVFIEQAVTQADTPAGGASAANMAVHAVLDEIAIFVNQTLSKSPNQITK